MTLETIKRLWELARLLHEARRDLAWGPRVGARREPWPPFTSAYSHNPIAYIDLALAQAEAAETHFNLLFTVKGLQRIAPDKAVEKDGPRPK